MDSVDHGRGYVDVVRYDDAMWAPTSRWSPTTWSMTPPMTNCRWRAPCDLGGREALEESLRVAHHREGLRRLGRQRFDEDELVRFALHRLWIALGEGARRYGEAEGVGAGMPPWADMIGFRDKLAHLYPSMAGLGQPGRAAPL